jgi:transketolase
VFTHDSIGLGKDGPTHQPVEQLSSLRLIPNFTEIRPADANEAREAWRIALKHRNGPVALILTRQKVPVIDRKKYASEKGIHKGAYILADTKGTPDIILIASGSEVHLALEAFEALKVKGVNARVVNMASFRLFEEQPQSYKNRVIPPQVKKRLAIEAGASLCWYKYVGVQGDVIGVDRFGASAPYRVIFEKYGFTVEDVIKRALKLLG